MELSIQAQDDNAYPPPPPSNVAPAPGSDDQGAYAPPATNQPPNETSDDPTGQVTFQTFYDSLSNQGNWIQTDDYGYVWQPNVNDPNWAPYTDGRWVYTDDGWTWDSNESYGWAVYHYGRWANLDGTGWVWVPGYTWAPAWVSWRYGDGYVGWAPLPPDSFAGIDYFGDGYDADYGFHIGGDCDDFYGIGPALYIFLPIGCVGYHDYHHWYHSRYDNFALINHTTNVTNINVARGGPAAGATFTHVTTGGPKVAQIDAASQTPVARATLARSSTPGANSLAQGTLSVYAPRVRTAGTEARPAQVATNLGTTAINRGADILHPPAVNARVALPPATDEQVAAARDAIGRAPASAKVMTDAGARSALAGPITSMRTAGASPVSPETRTYGSTPGAVYNNTEGHSIYGPVHQPESAPTYGETPSERAARETQSLPQRVYSPAPSYTPNYTPSSGAGSATESHTYTHATPTPSYAPSAAPVSRAPSSSGGGYGGYSGGSHGGSSTGSSSSSGAGGYGGGHH